MLSVTVKELKNPSIFGEEDMEKSLVSCFFYDSRCSISQHPMVALNKVEHMEGLQLERNVPAVNIRFQLIQCSSSL